VFTSALLREPGSDEGHLEGVGEGVERVKGLRIHGAHQREGAPLELNTRKRVKEVIHGTGPSARRIPAGTEHKRTGSDRAGHKRTGSDKSFTWNQPTSENDPR